MSELAIYLTQRPIHLAILIANLIPIIVLLIRRDRSFPLRIFMLYSWVSLLINLITDVTSSIRMNNITYNNIWVLLSTVIPLWFFYNVFVDDKKKRVILFIGAVYSIIFLIEFFYCNPNILNTHEHKFVLYSLPLRSVIIIAISLLFYYELIKELYIENLLESAIFWIVSCLFLYHAAASFSSTVFQIQYTWHSNNFFRSIARIPLYFEVITFVLISIGLMKSKKYVIE